MPRMKHLDSNVRDYSISELAAEFAVTARTLRFYEDKGLLRPTRSGQTRVYSASDHARLRLILRGKRVGFTLDEIREMMDLETLDSGSIIHMNTSLRRFRARILALKQQRADIDLSIADLEAGCAWLDARLVDREPSEEIKRNAQAFEALALARLET
ncbi:Transcriptional regulator, MerR family [hydrothermal vent metagenome]|uniref:Transcriptional regulator, MerR family n=1 Tax=hydrothermal vent metagenome TaxID=652676 RepID=A0A3B0RBB6_9ZZZZ